MNEFPYYVVVDSRAGTDEMCRLDDTLSEILGNYYQEDEFSYEVEDCGEDVGITVTVRFAIYPDAIAFVQHLKDAGYDSTIGDPLTKQNPANH